MMRQGNVGLDAVAGVDHLAVDLAGQRRLGQPGTNGCGDLRHRDRAGKIALGTVGERDVNHGMNLVCEPRGTKKARTGRA
jgi:hypothetical protein